MQNNSFKYFFQNTWLIQYLCIYNGIAYNFILKSGLTLILILAKLLENEYNKCFLFLDIENIRLGLQI